MKILICTFADKAIEDYSKITIPRMVEYATNHGYDFKVGTKMYANKHPSWGKIQMILDNLDKYNLILFLDADIWINRLNAKIDNILEHSKQIGICLNGDNGGKLLNCGSILVKGKQPNTQHTQDFFKKVWNTNSNDWGDFWEQGIINDFYQLNYQYEQQFIQVLPMRQINSYWLDTNETMPYNFVYHLMARTIEEKVKILNQLKSYDYK